MYEKAFKEIVQYCKLQIVESKDSDGAIDFGIASACKEVLKIMQLNKIYLQNLCPHCHRFFETPEIFGSVFCCKACDNGY